MQTNELIGILFMISLKAGLLMQKMVYCLREMGAIEPVGKQVNAILYQTVDDRSQTTDR